jgi:glycosyltransferase involved in cell wall biosynthesis
MICRARDLMMMTSVERAPVVRMPGSLPHHSSARRPTVTLLVTTWNEIDGMRAVMPLIRPEWVDQILVSDGGSTDGTLEYAREKGYEVVIQKGRGLINAYRSAWPCIRGDYVITFSPDGNSAPEKIPELVAKLQDGYDFVIVSRYLGGHSSDDDTWMTSFGNWLFTTMINVLFGGNWTDSLVMYRGYRKTVIPQLGLLKNRKIVEDKCERLSSWEVLSSVRGAKFRDRFRTGEIYGPEPARVGGEAKCSPYSGGIFAFLLIMQEFLFRHVETAQSYESAIASSATTASSSR